MHSLRQVNAHCRNVSISGAERMGLSREFVVAFVAGTLLLSSSTLPQEKAPPVSAKAKAVSSGSRGAAGKKLSIPRSEYVGDEACARCHQDKSDSYDKTARHITSQVANKNTIVGTFGLGENVMTTTNKNLTFRMDEKGDEFFQTAMWSSAEGSAARTRTERLDLVIGSGGKGQTYLYWRDNQLFQLPVGYSTVLHRWIISPGYIEGQADFERPIIPRCLECHATYFKTVFPDPGIHLYDTKNFVLGISCERCHGPGRRHAESYPSKSTAHLAGGIVNPAKLSPAGRRTYAHSVMAAMGNAFYNLRLRTCPDNRWTSTSTWDPSIRRRMWTFMAAGEAIDKESVLPGVEKPNLLDVPRCAHEGAGPRGHVATLLELPQGESVGDTRESGRRDRRELY